MKAAVPLLLAAGLAPILAQAIFAQDADKPAPVLNIDIESIKEGKDPAHEKLEGEWAAAMRKANFPAHYIALAARSGKDEVWFVQLMPSFAVNEEYDKAGDKEPLKATLDTLATRDGELKTTSRTLWAVYRPDLSYRPESLNMSKTRYVVIATYQVKLGKDDDFVAGAKAIFGAYAKGNVDMCFLAYQVTAGAPDGTYLFFSMMNSMKTMDAEPERLKTVAAGMSPGALDQFRRGAGDVFVSMEHNLFEVKPAMSYPPQSVVDGDPEFWKVKTPPKNQGVTIFPEEKKAK